MRSWRPGGNCQTGAQRHRVAILFSPPASLRSKKQFQSLVRRRDLAIGLAFAGEASIMTVLRDCSRIRNFSLWANVALSGEVHALQE